MPESVADRFTKAHEYIFMFAKQQKYYFDKEAIKEKCSEGTHPRRPQYKTPDGWDTSKGEGGHGSFHKQGREKGRKLEAAGSGTKNNTSFDEAMEVMPEYRNKRSVWTVPSKPYSEAHFATFPPALIEPCILAGSKPGDIVFDPFFGSGTVGEVAQKLGRDWMGLEIVEEYESLQKQRTAQAGLELC
jgi:site-specific DNA-methyltransferase (cytosine-N4-specific)